jgi:hypothetical protein
LGSRAFSRSRIPAQGLHNVFGSHRRGRAFRKSHHSLSGKVNDSNTSSLPFLFLVVFSNKSAIYLFPVLCSRSSRRSRENVCDRELSGNFDVATVSKIHFNVIFSKAGLQDQQISHVPQMHLLGRAEPHAVLEQPLGNLCLL